ncbi:hypothetical protein B0H16DRAFT_1571727 [Mycena metata]|uniref:Uncharacterized protein n=1 Tax=Mycena metata TaxID=1033252 RepID=A0AAD7I903_9AGAR|nr:hypothetical protein B0H16DRAFT_1571727 [Mycena metata]
MGQSLAQPSHPPGMDTRPMSELHLTEAEYAEYKTHYASDTMYKTVYGRSRNLRVIGFNEDTKGVFRTCNPDGHDYVEVPWSDMDSVKWIAQRIEDKIRVAFHHWYLATADGVVFKTFGELVGSTAAFQVPGQVVLTLLMPTDLATFAATHLKQHKWKKTTAAPCTSRGELEKCVAEFHLIDAQPSPGWAMYRGQRKAADKYIEEALEHYAGDERPQIYDKIEAAVADVLELTDLGDQEDAIHDCIVPLSVELGDDGWGNVSHAEVFSRVYSPTKPTAVDVYLEYHYRTRYESVEFYCNVYYRLEPINDTKLNLRMPLGPNKMNGFYPVFEMGLADIPPGRRWRAIDERTFGISTTQTRALHSILFGDTSGSDSEGLADKISVREMLELLLASVGISFYAASDPNDEDDQDEFIMGDLRWEGLEGSERWLGRKIRSVAGDAPMNNDEESEDGNPDDDDDDEYDSDEDEEEDEAEGEEDEEED